MPKPIACVIGDLSLVRPLGRAGVPVAVATTRADDDTARSRYSVARVLLPSLTEQPEAGVDALVSFARRCPAPPVLFYQGDHDLLLVSREREVLAGYFRMVLPDADLVEDLVDKLRFAKLASERELPVPETLTLRRGSDLRAELAAWTIFPCVLKPSTRMRWGLSEIHALAGAADGKAVRVENRSQLEALLPLLESEPDDFVLQDCVEGGEERVLSYHAYVRPGGEVVAEFTGRKVRTSPRLYGQSSCVEITDDEEVKRAGRSVLERLDFAGVIKLDFKSDSRDDRLYLLEANPRFNLWHHPGALAGVNLPYLVYTDLAGKRARPSRRHGRAGVRWMSARRDLRAAREYRAAGELTLARWVWQRLRVEIDEDFTLRDPGPGIASLWRTVRRLTRRRGAAANLHAAKP
jgi:D-aspartate ligase